MPSSSQSSRGSASIAVGVSDRVFLFPQPVPLSSKENPLVWIAVNEDGVSILDHNTMVREEEGWLPRSPPSPEQSFLLSRLKSLSEVTMPPSPYPLPKHQALLFSSLDPAGRHWRCVSPDYDHCGVLSWLSSLRSEETACWFLAREAGGKFPQD